MLARFSAIIEQDKAKEMLRRALRGGKLAHAYLFRGPTGVGKKTAARALAATINCLDPPGAAPGAEADLLAVCGHCRSCRKFASANHPDFLEIAPEGSAIKIKQIREVKKALVFPPLEAGSRVVLLCEVHTMRREAANSLLKALEEPPTGTIFILTGDEAGAILPTILSRCQIVPFFPLSVEKLATTLAREEQISPEAAATLAAVAEGSLGRARLLRSQNLLDLRRQVLTMLLAHRPEQPEAVGGVLNLAEKCAGLKEELEDFLDLLSSCFHDLAVIAGGGQRRRTDGAAPPRLLINRDLEELLALGGQRWDPAGLDRRLQRFRRAKAQLKRNCNRALVCEVLFFDLL